MTISPKVRSIHELATILESHRQTGQVVVHCHGVFDLLHVGHIKHLQAARRLGDLLVVTLTRDEHVNKGPHRPAFTQDLRAEALAALDCVAYVAVNEWPTAVETIQLLRPSKFVKGMVRIAGKRDHTDAIDREKDAVESVGGELVLTDEETFSASSLLNQFLDILSEESRNFLVDFRRKYSDRDVIRVLEGIRPLRVLTIGETILDQYTFVNVMAKSNKDPILAARKIRSETYAGGILAISNHLAQFCGDVQLMTYLGETAPQREFILGKLAPTVKANFIMKPNAPTIVKQRFVDEYFGSKLFEVYVMDNEMEVGPENDALCRALEECLPSFDVVVVADYGHGLFTDRVIQILCEKSKFLAVNAQSNAGNRGYNMISKYPRADFISIDESEARLETRNPKDPARRVIETIASRIDCPRILVTLGRQGCILHERGVGFTQVPAFATKLVDRIGAGDAVLAITAPCVALGVPLDMVGFIGNVVGAEACRIVGNKEPVSATGLHRHITSLLP